MLEKQTTFAECVRRMSQANELHMLQTAWMRAQNLRPNLYDNYQYCDKLMYRFVSFVTTNNTPE